MPATIPLLQEGRYSIEQEFPYLEGCSLFQAYDTQGEAPVAIVEVPARLPKVATASQREAANAAFTEQAALVCKFRHKSVVAVKTFFNEGGRNFLVTDPMDGIDLASVLKDQKHPFSVAEMTGWADTLLDALNVMHNSRPAMVYRNLRPEHIVLKADGSVSLTAAGMVCVGDSGRSATSLQAGSPIAFSPLEQIWSGLDAASQKVIISRYDESSEKLLKQDMDARSDLYSLGATLYLLVTGKTPVDALERSIEMIEGNADPLTTPNSLEPAIPVEISDVIMKAMEVKREYRFDSAAIMRQVLKTALVRVKEREAEEALNQTVSLQDISPATKGAASVSVPVAKAEQKPVPAQETIVAPSEPSTTPTAPKAAPARPTETFNLAELEDDLLGLLDTTVHTSEAPQQPKIEPAAVVAKESVQGSAAATQTPAEVAEEQTVISTIESSQPELPSSSEPEPIHSVEEKVEEAEPMVAAAAAELPVTPAPKDDQAAVSFDSRSDSELFNSPEPKGKLGLPAMAVGAVVLVAAIVGGWFFLGSKPAPSAAGVETKTAAPAAVQPEAPSQSGYQPAESQPETSAAVAEEHPQTTEPASPETTVVEDQPQRVASSAAPTKTKKTAPAAAPVKPAAQKKAVTVDDLINDN